MTNTPATSGNKFRIGIIIPACNEEESLPAVLRELQECLPMDGREYRIAVGINASTDGTAGVARAAGVVVGETQERGYGHGCQAAITALLATEFDPHAYIFMAGDGANDPQELLLLVEPFLNGASLVLGQRTRCAANYHGLLDFRRIANLMLGLYVTGLGGFHRFFVDLGAYRLISRDLFEHMQMHEWTYGWTIEAQLKACFLKAKIVEVNVTERPRQAGEQKVSGVSLRHTLRVAREIFAAGWRVYRQQHRTPLPSAGFVQDSA